MANKKPEEPKKGSPAWMATFSDLMNLLLCFFVLLFAMSSVDADKWEQVVASFSNSFSIFSAGSTMIGEGTLVGEGTTQLNELDEMAQAMGQSATDKGEDVKDQTSGNVNNNHSGPSNGEQSGNPADGQNNQQNNGQNDEPNNGQDSEQSLEEKLNQANFEETQGMLDEISEMTELYNLDGMMELGMDQNGKYVEIIISGSVLFESGSAELKEDSKVLMSKVGDIIRAYDGHNAQIIGHTDNIPVRSSKYGSNDLLSSARAIAAAQYLVKEKNIDVTRLSWTGRGEYDPVASNATAEGRARNRRIEIRIYNSFNSD